jgi:hypothetical protein
MIKPRMGSVRSAHGSDKKFIKILVANLKIKIHSEDLGVDVRIILNFILRR